MSLPNRLKEILAQKNWAPARLDREARLSAGSTTRYIDGHSPTLKSLQAIASAVGVTLSELLEEGAPKPAELPPEPNGASQ
jgi:transcriptional regulator with XRE-family HTH domain